MYVCSRSITPVNWSRNSFSAERKSNESHTSGAAVGAAIAIAILVTFVKCVFFTMQFRTFPISVTRVYTLLCLFSRRCFIKLYCWLGRLNTPNENERHAVVVVVFFNSVCRLLLANTATNEPSDWYNTHTHISTVCVRARLTLSA